MSQLILLIAKISIFLQASIVLHEDVIGCTDAEAEEVLNELNLLTEIEESSPGPIHLEMNLNTSKWGK